MMSYAITFPGMPVKRTLESVEDPPAKQDTAENYQYVFLFVSFTIVYGIVVFPSNLDVCDWRFRKVCPQCNTVVHVKQSVCNCGHVFASHGVLLLESPRTQ